MLSVCKRFGVRDIRIVFRRDDGDGLGKVRARYPGPQPLRVHRGAILGCNLRFGRVSLRSFPLIEMLNREPSWPSQPEKGPQYDRGYHPRTCAGATAEDLRSGGALIG
jgi:hypothetical protein